MREPLTIGDRRELFVDREVIEELEGAQFVLHRPQPQEVAIKCDDLWEATAPGYSTVYQDEGRYRLYYRAMPEGGTEDADDRQVTCYAESDDGINWQKPTLNLIEHNGSSANNIVYKGVISHNLTPFKDDHPDCREDHRYKAVGGVREKSDGLWALTSPDGIHWQKLGNEPLSFPGNFDSQNLIFWDANSGVYRAYWRAHRRDDPKVPEGRDVRTSVSEDFVRWSEPEWLDYEPNRSGTAERDQTDDPTGDHHQFYCNGVLSYNRAPHLVLGFPHRYVDRGWTASTDVLPDRERRQKLADLNVKGGRPTREGTVVTDVLFMASRDGKRFFVWPQAFIRPGIQRSGSWYYGDTWNAWGLVETASRYASAPPELSFYISEADDRAGPGRLRRYTLRLDGFGSIYAPLSGGSAVTRTLVFEGRQLQINFSTSAGGRARIEIQDDQGQSIPGFSLDDCHLQYGDQVDRVVTWKEGADVGNLANRPVRLKFELKDADIFAFQFLDAD